MPGARDESFGARVRAARGYGGMSQRQLAAAIAARYPDAPVSASTIKRLEAGDPSVRGSLIEWTVWVADATRTPDWFLEGGWDAPRRQHESPESMRLWRSREMRVIAQAVEDDPVAAIELLKNEPGQLQRLGLHLREGESADRLAGRLEELSRVEDLRGREGLSLVSKAAHERMLIRQGVERARREALLHELPRGKPGTEEHLPQVNIAEIVLARTVDPKTNALLEVSDASGSRTDGAPWLFRDNGNETAFATLGELKSHYEKLYGPLNLPTEAPLWPPDD
jgi:transcriptional regulator with XRE-family HTH domain